MTFTGQANASAKSKPIHPAPRLTGSATTRPRTTGAGTPIDTTSYCQSAVSFFTPATMARGVSRGPESIVRFNVCPVTSSLTRVPPTSTTRILLGDGTGMEGILSRASGRRARKWLVQTSTDFVATLEHGTRATSLVAPGG